jgi:hypothetical protein
MVNMVDSRDLYGDSILNKDETKTNLAYETVEDFSKAVYEQRVDNGLKNELDNSRPDYPDNLNNGRFQMKLVK